ncbi:SIS domain-containing protein [Elioraea sp.]|uniref:SIS domain-containing protein n=1 Tax=Elioraea sp. TaxID=2185103 RepID=UPI0025C6315E|nr:SIS domain-containing protein [Elioraea sp.]
MTKDELPPALIERFRALRAEPSTDEGNDPHRRARVDRTREEALVQGSAISETLAAAAPGIADLAAAAAGRDLRRAVVVGCGDSWIVGTAVRLAWERCLGVPLEPAQAFDWAHYAAVTADAGTIVFGLSASGATPPVQEALNQAKARGAMTIGLSNTPDRPLLTDYDHGFLIKATRKGWPTQSSTAAAALLIAIAAALAASRGRASAADPARQALAALPGLMDATAAATDAPMAALAASLARVRYLQFTGAGPHLAAAAFGAAKVRELSPIHAAAMPLEEYHHYRSQKPGDVLVMVAPDAASHARALDTAIMSRGCSGRLVALLPEGETEIAALADDVVRLPVVPDIIAPLIHAVPLHLFAYHFAIARFAQGLGYPGAFPEGTAAP